MILSSSSRSADAGHLRTADIVAIARDADIQFRLIGGSAISLLVWAHGAAGLVPSRETDDADLGVPPEAPGAVGLVVAFEDHGGANQYAPAPGSRPARARSTLGHPRR